MSLKAKAKRVWNFVWKSDSAASWLIDLVLAFLIVRFVIFPVLSLVLATSLPLVVIESGSMEHNGNFDQWWQEHGSWYVEANLSKEQVRSWDFNNGLDKGDIIVSKGLDEYEVGDVVIFKTEQPTPIIHRIVSYNKNFQHFETKGDNNPRQLIYEEKVTEDQMISKAVFRIPKLGWIKLVFVEVLRANA